MMAPVEERTIQSGDYEVHTWMATASCGPPVVLLHGFGGWARPFWQETLKALAPRYSVYAPDLVGFGNSTKPDPSLFAVDDPLVPSARILSAYLDTLGLDHATLVGTSMGGGIALRLALDEPGRVDRLALVASMGLGRSIHYAYKAIANPVLGPQLVKPDKWRIRRMWHTLVYDETLITDDLVDENHAILSQPGASEVLLTARHGVNVVGQRNVFGDALKTIPHSTLIVWGRNDRIFPLRHAERAARTMPTARLEVIERCGHLPPFERPAVFNRILGEWLEREHAPHAADEAGVEAAEG